MRLTIITGPSLKHVPPVAKTIKRIKANRYRRRPGMNNQMLRK